MKGPSFWDSMGTGEKLFIAVIGIAYIGAILWIISS